MQQFKRYLRHHKTRGTHSQRSSIRATELLSYSNGKFMKTVSLNPSLPPSMVLSSSSLISRKWCILSHSISVAAAADIPFIHRSRNFRSKAALDALDTASEEKIPNLILYNYPSFSGAFAALFSRLYHSTLNLSCLILPFSSVEPLRLVNQISISFFPF